MKKQKHSFRNADAAPAASGGSGTANNFFSGSNTKTSGLFGAAASIINNTVTQLFQNKVYKSQAELLKAQAAAELTKSRIAELSSDQQIALANQLQSLNDDNAKEKLLNDTVVAITTAMLNSTAYNPNDIYIAALQSTGTGASSGAANATATGTAAKNQIKLAVIIILAAVAVVGIALMIKKENQ